MTDLTISDKILQFEDESGLIFALLKTDYYEKHIKEFKAELHQRIIDYITENNIEHVEINDEFVVKIGNKITTKFKTQEIYDLLGFTEVQRRVLPENPTFRKTDLKEALGEDEAKRVTEVRVDPKIEVKQVNKKYLTKKEIQWKLLKLGKRILGAYSCFKS